MRPDVSRLRLVRKRLLKTVRGRATLVTLAISAIVLGVCLVMLLELVRSTSERSVEAEAAYAARRTSTMVAERRLPEAFSVDPGVSNLIQVVGKDGKVLASSAALQGKPPISTAWPEYPEMRVDLDECPSYLNQCVHVAGLLVRESAYGQPVIVYGAEPLPEALTDRFLPFRLGSIALLLLLLIGVGTWFMLGRSLAQVEAIRRELDEITTTADLRRRVLVLDTGGEIDHLAETVNDTLHRLEEATEGQRRFVSDASHDLRNPIAGLRMQLELLLTEPDDHEWKPDVRRALRDVERLDEIVNDLLELARLDAGTPQRLERLDPAELVAEECDRRVSRVPVYFTAETAAARGVAIRGNRTRLGRALGNLLANAERHANSRVDVHLGVDADRNEVFITVIDDGPGIPPESRERIFERFARLKDARELDQGGTGLGLPIARSIAEAHGGSLTVADNAPGAQFVLRIPVIVEKPRGKAPESPQARG